ncbi:DUF4386 family protein [Wenxinia marina]|nr:DUF4386 family protein [Wenxinia marina]
MTDLHRAGGLAALVCAATYIFGFAFLFAVLLPAGFGIDGAEAEATLAAIAGARGAVTLWYFVIYVVNALALAILAAALAERIAIASPALGRLTFGFGIVWTVLVLGAGMVMNVGLGRVLPLHEAGDPAALELWRVVDLVENGLGGGNEIAGGAWALALGIAGLVTGRLPKALCWGGLVIGASGLLTVLPGIGEVPGAVFGLGYIVWFLGAGVVLLRGRSARSGAPA